MRPIRVVVDTSVLVAALQSSQGASFRLLSLVGRSDRFEICVSTALALEYEHAAKRLVPDRLSLEDANTLLDFLCAAGTQQGIYFLLRPVLSDPSDDFVVELAAHAGAELIITFNLRDFIGCQRFGVEAVTPVEFLRRIGESI